MGLGGKWDCTHWVIIFTFCFGDAYFASPKTLYQTIQFNISRVFLLAIFAYALFFCSKNYFSSKHNAIINHHRTNALRSYEALAKAAKDTANTDIILNHAAACVFSPQNTGFSGGKADGKLPGAGSPPYFVSRLLQTAIANKQGIRLRLPTLD